jgi:glycosyltransferase involved in cell wall biosynthesis
MKVVIQIPCYNEEKALPITLDALPRSLPGVDQVEWLIIDDGSTDQTAEVALAHGVDHIISHHKNMGLAKAFMTGLHACLEQGADIIVNTDADNQYCADCIPDLIRPIIEGKAEIVIGARHIDEVKDFSWIKKVLQKLGSWTVRLASGTDIPDAPSGFRAITRDAARKLNVFNNHTYTLETIIQAGQKDIPIIPSYIRRSIFTILRIFVVYKPFRFFASIGSILISLGILIGLRFLYYYFSGHGSGHVQSLIFASILIGMGFQTILVAFVVDLISVNRRMLEELQYKNREFPRSKTLT